MPAHIEEATFRVPPPLRDGNVRWRDWEIRRRRSFYSDGCALVGQDLLRQTNDGDWYVYQRLRPETGDRLIRFPQGW